MKHTLSAPLTLVTEDPEKFVTDLLALHRSVFGDARMADEDDSDETDDEGSEDDSDETDDEGSEDDSDETDDEGSEDDKPLGKAGQKALDAIKKRDKANRAKLRAQATEIARLKAGTKTGKAGQTGNDDEQPDPEQIRKEARAEADAAILQTRVMDKIEAKAGGRFALEPEDVAALLMRRHSVEDFLDEDNKIDMAEIDDALTELLKDKPNLAAKGSKRFNGSGDGGRRKDKTAKPKDLTDAITQRLSKT